MKDYRAEMMGVQNQFMEQIIKVQEKQVGTYLDLVQNKYPRA